jgi:hypothetical protein
VRARFQGSPRPVGGGRSYRPAGDAQAALERWWAEIARVFPRGAVPPGGTGGDAGREHTHGTRR